MDCLTTALGITSGFEGGGFNSVVGNFDGQGLSAGALQWCYGQGTLQGLLTEYIKQYGDIEGFPTDITPTASMTTKDAVAFAATMQSNNQLLPAWHQAWQTFLATPECIAIQAQFAEPYGRYADYMCQVWKMPTMRAYCFFFDIRVQNGSMRGLPGKDPTTVNYANIIAVADPTNRAIWAKLSPSNAQKVLMQATYDRIQLAIPQFRQNIMARKGTIAMGSGFVDGKVWDLSPQLGISSLAAKWPVKLPGS